MITEPTNGYIVTPFPQGASSSQHSEEPLMLGHGRVFINEKLVHEFKGYKFEKTAAACEHWCSELRIWGQFQHGCTIVKEFK